MGLRHAGAGPGLGWQDMTQKALEKLLDRQDRLLGAAGRRCCRCGEELPWGWENIDCPACREDRETERMLWEN